MLNTWHPCHVHFGEVSFRITPMCLRDGSAASGTVSPQKRVYVSDCFTLGDRYVALIARFAPEVQT